MPDCAGAAGEAARAGNGNRQRSLVVMADDYGIGPATSRAILELGQHGTVTATALLVNSPFAEAGLAAWQKAGEPMELGWHPCLTLDQPILPPDQVASLVGPDGCFWPLRQFLRRWALGRLRATEIAAELHAQYTRFVELVGRPPTVINSHQHIQLFTPVGDLLLTLLRGQQPLPYLRRVSEPWSMLARIPGARVKRGCLTLLGRRQVHRQIALGFPGNDCLAGITDPPWVHDPLYLERWLTRVPGDVVELMCHPGYHDTTLIGRDCGADDGLLQRRVCELHLLRQARFSEACQAAGFVCAAPSEVIRLRTQFGQAA